MLSRIENNPDNNDVILQKAIWLLAAIALNAVELAIPRVPFLPWLKPGFANIITILWIVRFGFKDALLFTALRVWISGFYFGFSLFTFCLSLGGGMMSAMVMSALWITLGKRGIMGAIGIAVMGALFHNAGQLAIVYFMLAQNLSLLSQIPFMLGASVVFGIIVGALVPAAAKIFENADSRSSPLHDINAASNSVNRTDKFITVLTLAASVSLMFINNMYILIASAIIFSLIPLLITPKKPSVIFYPARFYMLFLFVAATYLFFPYGTRINAVPFITNEGLSASTKQCLRLWCWLQTIHIFRKFNFHEIFMLVLHKFFPNKKDTLAAGMIALKHFPEVVRFAKSKKKISVAALLFRPKMVLTKYIGDIRNRICEIT